MIDKKDLDDYVSYANRRWHKYAERMSKGEHVFLKDINMVNNNTKEIRENNLINKHAPEKVDNLQPSDYALSKCYTLPTEHLEPYFVERVFESLVSGHTILNWNELVRDLDNMSDRLLPQTTTLKDSYQNDTQADSNSLNILILGAGPAGLYMANYFRSLFNFNLKVLVVDSRIVKPGYREPYTRRRLFGFNIFMLAPFFRKVGQLTQPLDEHVVQIRHLESLMYILYCGDKGSICFTDELKTEASLEAFIKSKNVHLVFDSTGGRFKNSYLPKEPKYALPKNIKMSDDNYKVVKVNNEYRLERKNNITDRYYMEASAFVDGQHVQSTTVDFVHPHDVTLMRKLDGKCIKLKKGSEDKLLSYFDNVKDVYLTKSIQSMIATYPTASFTFRIFEAYIRHKIDIASVVDNSWIYVGTGDTIFASHFGVGAGLNRLIPFAQELVWKINTFY